MTTFLPDSACQHYTWMVYLDDAEEIPAGGCSYVYLVRDFSFGRLPEDKQLLVIPFVTRSLHMAGLGEYEVGPLHHKTKRSLKCIGGMLGSGKGVE